MLSKSAFIRGVQCEKSLYLHKKRPYLRDPLPPELRAKFKRGHDVGEYARDLFLGGLNLHPSGGRVSKKTLQLTASHIQNRTPILYEVPFVANNLTAILDILTLKNEKWNAYEVKSSLSISETYLLDITFQSYVISSFGLENVDYFIIHVNPDYIFEEKIDIHSLFRIVNVNFEIEKRIEIVKSKAEQLLKVENMQRSPDISIGLQCDSPYLCDFKQLCWKHVPKISVFSMPGLSIEDKFSFYNDNKIKLEDVAPLLENKLAKYYFHSVLEQKTIIDAKGINSLLSKTEKQFVFFKILHSKISIPQYSKTHAYEKTPYAIVLWKNNNIEVEIFRKENRWEQINEFFEKNIKNNIIFASYDEKDVFLSVLQSLKRIFEVSYKEKIELFDLASVFQEGMYCSKDFDTDLSFQSVNNHFIDLSDNDNLEIIAILKEYRDKLPALNDISLIDNYEKDDFDTTIREYLKFHVLSVFNMYRSLNKL